MIQKLEHIGIYVDDMDASIQFYEEVLGLRLVERVQLNEEVELSFLSYPGQDDVQVELVGRSTEDTPREGIVNHLAFTVADIEEEVDRLRKAGVAIDEQWPKTILDGRKIAFFDGPNGEKLELFEPAPK